MKTNKCAYDQNRKKPGGDVQAVSPAAGPAPLLGPAVNRGPEAQPDQLRYRASAKGLALREGQVEESRPAPESSTLPSSLPPFSGPLRGQGGALREEGVGVASSERKAPPP